MAFGKKAPKTVSQITAGLQKMLDELSVSEAQFQEKERQNEHEIARIEAEQSEIHGELTQNRKIASKFKDLLGVEE